MDITAEFNHDILVRRNILFIILGRMRDKPWRDFIFFNEESPLFLGDCFTLYIFGIFYGDFHRTAGSKKIIRDKGGGTINHV